MRPTTFIISVLLCCVYLPSAFGDWTPPALKDCSKGVAAEKIECEKDNARRIEKAEPKAPRKPKVTASDEDKATYDKDLAKYDKDKSDWDNATKNQNDRITGLEDTKKTKDDEHEKLSGTADKAMEEDGKRRTCGDYGGLDCKQTTGIHEGIRAGIGLVNNAGAAATSLNGVAQTSKLSEKGSSATNSDFTDANRENLRFAGWQNSANSLLTMGAGAIQFIRGSKHRKSADDIEEQREGKIAELDGLKTEADKVYTKALKDAEVNYNAAIDGETEPAKKKEAETAALTARNKAEKEAETAHKNELASIDKKKANVYRNSDAEIEAQMDARTSSQIAGGVTMMGAANQAAEAARMGILMKNQAAGSETTADAPVFSMSNQGGQVIDPGSAINPNDTVETAAVNTSDTGMANEKIDGGLKDFDPNFGNNNVAGQAPGEFKDAALTSAPGGGSSPGGSGGTSAARDSGDGKQDAVAGKPQSGGKYEGGDGGGSKFSRGGGGGGSGRSGVGLDGGFADLLKRMLPGGADDKAASKAAIGLDNDRTPASDRAAVISREKNIFKEISKRYLKKNSEGAVLFQ